MKYILFNYSVVCDIISSINKNLTKECDFMKKLIAILLSLVCILSLVGCSQETTYQSTKIPNVSIRILNVSPSCATIIIKDTNDKPFVYGEWL